MKSFKAYVSRGKQLLLSPGGEHIPRLVWTEIYQNMSEPGQCSFRALVNGPADEGYMQYSDQTERLTMPSGEILPVEVIFYRPSEIIAGESCDELTVKCTVEFPFDTVNVNLSGALHGPGNQTKFEEDGRAIAS